MTPQVIATDLDGTLLRSDTTLSPRTRAALRAARSAGVRVVLATARPVRVVAAIFGHGGAVGGPGDGSQDLFDAAICGNGAVLYDPRASEPVLTHPLLPELATRVITQARLVLPGVFFACETGQRVLHEPGYDYRPSFDDERYPVLTLDELCAGPLVKLMALSPRHSPDVAWALLRPSLGDLVTCTWSAGTSAAGYPTILEIAAPGVTKAAALAQLCTQWSIGPEGVVAFGDARNDLEMLAWAGAGYAVANAHPEVLAATAGSVPSNDEDGVACFLEELTAALRRSPGSRDAGR